MSMTQKCVPNVPARLFPSTIGSRRATSVGLTHASTLKPPLVPTLRPGDAGNRTVVLLPLKRNASPTFPVAKATGPTSTRELPAAESSSSISPRHQLTSPEGAGVHVGIETVRVALELLVEPTPLLTITE